jgi:hypothetical protein
MRKILFITFFIISNSILSQSNCNCLQATDYGVLPDGTTDNTSAIQTLLNQASIDGNALCFKKGVYLIASTITVPAGVTIVGAGRGSNPNATPYNGTIFKYTGNNDAIVISGSNVTLDNFIVYGYGSAPVNGIKVLANNGLVESVVLNKMLIHGFISGTSLGLIAQNNGGIAYCSFYDVRIRYAKTGIEIKEVDQSSFVNSNNFFHGVVSGGSFDYALLVNGGNNNVFWGTDFDVLSCQNSVIHVNNGQIIGENLRIEANLQPIDKPVIFFSQTSSQSKITGLYGGGLIKNLGNNDVVLSSSNSFGEVSPTENLLLNSSFQTYNSSFVPDFWTISNANVTTNILANENIIGSKIVELTLPAGQSTEFNIDTNFNPKIGSNQKYTYANYSILAKTNQANRVKVTYNSAYGMVTSIPHSGSELWETIGLQAIANGISTQPKVIIDNTSGTEALKVELTSPSFNFGLSIPPRLPANINTQGGVISGVLSHSLINNYSFISGTSYLVLPKQGNYFIISGSNINISRINHLTADKFIKGTVITLIFNNSGISVSSGAYLNLKSGFTSTAANTSLTLISNGDGTWREVNRNN